MWRTAEAAEAAASASCLHGMTACCWCLGKALGCWYEAARYVGAADVPFGSVPLAWPGCVAGAQRPFTASCPSP